MASKNVIFGVNSWHRFMPATRFFLLAARKGRGSRECCFCGEVSVMNMVDFFDHGEVEGKKGMPMTIMMEI